MKIYSVYQDPGALSPDRDATAIKEGFCWPAFFFGPLWALWHRMWFAALGLLAVLVLAELAADLIGADPLSASAITLGVMTLVGFVANDARGQTLRARGWRQAGIAAGRDREGALLRFFDALPDPAAGRPS
jgi:hypothetical protein